ncbi:thiamine-monophosphate kinase [bacterium]|nr:thiamine-monophosphate kinase [bacterium]
MLPDKSPEFALIDSFREQLRAARGVELGIGDDAAVVEWGSRLGLLAADMLLDGVHFETSSQSPVEIGRKALAVNLSDVAAMAGVPRFALVSLALPHVAPREFVEGVFAGLKSLADEFDTAIVGGDTTSWDGPFVINVSIVGDVAADRAVTRGGAQPGDWLFVTGELGGSLLGRHLTFPPRVREAQTLHREVTLHAMIDISDGLAADLYHILEESRVGAILDSATVPISEAARQLADNRSPLEHALGDGEDFELLFAVSPDDGARLLASNPLSIPLSRIGEITADQSCQLRSEDSTLQPLPRLGWSHLL